MNAASSSGKGSACVLSNSQQGATPLVAKKQVYNCDLVLDAPFPDLLHAHHRDKQTYTELKGCFIHQKGLKVPDVLWASLKIREGSFGCYCFYCGHVLKQMYAYLQLSTTL